MAINAPVYCTREDVKGALDVKETARSNQQIDRAIESASRTIEGLCHRLFYPQTATRYFDWPNGQYAAPWRLWLDSNELISVTTLTTGGDIIAAPDFLLRRADNHDQPPYNLLELNRGTNAAFGGSTTPQQDIAITGLYGYNNDETQVADVDEAMTATETDLDITDSSGIGVGSILRVGTERLIVAEKTMRDTGVNIDAGDSLTASNADVSITLSTATAAPTVGEIILIDSERMLVVDRAGATLTVKRAWDGSVLAAHAAGADIYALRTLTVTRGALGTAPATMTAGDDIHRWDPPGPVRELAVAEALSALHLGSTAYSPTRRAGEGERRTSNAGLADLRERVYVSHGRKARLRGV